MTGSHTAQDESHVQHRQTMIVVTPIAPAATGNGLAMRCNSIVAAAAAHHDVVIVVVPVAGVTPAGATCGELVAEHDHDGSVRAVTLQPAQPGDPTTMIAWLSNPLWRDRLPMLAPLPAMAAGVPPALVDEAVQFVGSVDVAGVVGCRLAVGLLALALAECYETPLIIDADDDDVAYHLNRHDPEVAAQWQRVGALVLPKAALAFVSSPADREPLADRFGLVDRVVVIPNAVRLPAEPERPPTAGHNLLMVANFTYEPNDRGARWFIDAVLPLLDPKWHLTLVGAASTVFRGLASERVSVTGWVDDVASSYASADVVIVPVHAGSGTRIKVLEAFAAGRPVVSTMLGVAGIAAIDGEHVLIADDPNQFASAIERATRADVANRLIPAARHLVADRYHATDVIDRSAHLMRAATASTEHRAAIARDSALQ